MLVEPTQGRAVIEDEGGKIRITIPSKFNLFVVLFLLIWLGLWTMGESFAFRQVFLGKGPLFGQGFILFWLCGWTLGGAFVFLAVLRMCFGKEVIEVDPSLFSCRKTIFSMGFSRQYRMEEIRNLRADAQWGYYRSTNSFGSYNSFGTYYRPYIAFDYGAKTVRFGYGVDEAEVGQLVKKLQERFALKA